MSQTPDAELSEAERRRRRASVFGEVLPEGTVDDRPDRTDDVEGADESSGAGESGGANSAGESASEAWLRRQVPPHHG